MEKSNLTITQIEKSIAELTTQTDHKTLAIWAADCAEHVLPYFEKHLADDPRPRQAIAAGRAWVSGELKMTDARKAAFASHAAARDTSQFAEAEAAARAAGHAAATAHVATHAIYAARYASKAVQQATGSKDEVHQERDWQYQHLLELEKDLGG